MQFSQVRQSSTILVAALLMVFSPAIWAHAKLEKCIPAADSVVKESPKNIRLEFNEKLERMFSSATVNDMQGHAVTVEKSVVDSSDPKIMTQGLPLLSSGRYQVKWTAVTVDGHRVKGAYIFSVAK